VTEQPGEARKKKAKMSSVFSGDETAPFFGFLGAAAALVFSCTPLLSSPPSSSSIRAERSSFYHESSDFPPSIASICRRCSVTRLDLVQS
jgi:hypothetical protein